uniref:Uncharacterized protein n=1 Tax=Anguilla anguilla TaxID=7936 RepID=A0A0E9WVR3_ANGAN
MSEISRTRTEVEFFGTMTNLYSSLRRDCTDAIFFFVRRTNRIFYRYL